jgi:hypothetical protein
MVWGMYADMMHTSRGTAPSVCMLQGLMIKVHSHAAEGNPLATTLPGAVMNVGGTGA